MSDGYVDFRWGEAERERIACETGDCRYAQERCQPRDGKGMWRCDHDHGCLGYRGTKYIEHGEALMRYRLCRRHLAWWKTHQQRVRQERANAVDTKKAAAKAWAP